MGNHHFQPSGRFEFFYDNASHMLAAQRTARHFSTSTKFSPPYYRGQSTARFSPSGQLKDSDLYFFFNEGEQPLSVKVTVAGSITARQVQEFDTTSGNIGPSAGATFTNGRTTIPLELRPWGTRLVVISR